MAQPTIYQKIREAVEAIQNRTGLAPEIGVVLGSGLGSIAHEVSDPTVIPYTEIPHFHGTSVEGHAGQMIVGRLHDVFREDFTIMKDIPWKRWSFPPEPFADSGSRRLS
jgi:purine nucleoside phosphorylase